jgi:hypothetical protein
MSTNDEEKERIERLKKEFEAYLNLAPFLEIDEETKQKRIDMFLDDLSDSLKKL